MSVQQSIDPDTGEIVEALMEPKPWRPRVVGGDRDFWNGSSALTKVYEWSLIHLLAPYAVLMNLLARVIAAIPPTIVLEALVGASPASLNLAICVVGWSGQGKDRSIDDADVLVPDVRDAVSQELSTGEGVTAIHAQRVQDIDPETGKPVPGTMHNEPRHIRAILRCSESATLKALIDRKDSTLIGTLNNAWSGLSLGGAVKTQENNLRVPAHGYRQVLVIASQPAYVGTIVAQHDNGFLQRLVWASAYDPRINTQVPTDVIVDETFADDYTPLLDPDAIPADPSEDVYRNLYIAGSIAGLLNPDSYRLATVTFPKRARREAVEFRKAHNRPDINEDDPDAHRILCQMKLAAALHFLQHDHKGKPCDLKVTEKEWSQAAHLMHYSSTIREESERKGREARQSNDAEQIADRTEAAELAEVKVVGRAKNRIVSILERKDPERRGLPNRDLRNSLSAPQRRVFTTAIDQLKEDGVLDWRETDGATFYSLSIPDPS